VQLQADPELVKNKHVRLDLKAGEECPTNIDCLSLAPRWATAESVEMPELTMGEFDWHKTLTDELTPLDPEVRLFIEDRLNS